jgi:hypothetical protein
MSNELEQKIMGLINGAEQQIPEIAQEYLAWHYTMACAGVWAFGGLTILCIFIFTKNKGFKFLSLDEPEWRIPVGVISGLLGILFGVFTVVSVCDLVKIKTVPKVYLIDSIRGHK